MLPLDNNPIETSRTGGGRSPPKLTLGDITSIGSNYSTENQLIMGNIEVTDGALYLRNTRVLRSMANKYSLVKCCNRQMKLSNVTVEGDVWSLNGGIKIKQDSEFITSHRADKMIRDIRNIRAINGNIALINVLAKNVQSHGGRVDLRRGSHILGDVFVDDASRFFIKNARIDGLLKTSGNQLIIGDNTFIRRVILRSVKDASPQQVERGAIAEPEEKQLVVLRAGAVLREINFDAPQCVLVLHETARYEGPRDIEGLMVRQV
ncbi:hypothetical protein [Martelella alba]|uniref:Uncharacterized protein n=1 Tax=Martelella alba TaxID=2590451 RepID=A0ABY2SI97_9HYPH|nr:hypothetical protein [Martelella alba]TKI05101.1 hypothetical protein FCN80_15460 [Martelella alba]